MTVAYAFEVRCFCVLFILFYLVDSKFACKLFVYAHVS
jgi:hypothetical protein